MIHFSELCNHTSKPDLALVPTERGRDESVHGSMYIKGGFLPTNTTIGLHYSLPSVMSLDIFRITPEPPESLTAHIRVLSDDRISSRSHELLDARVLEMLDKEEHRHLKDPQVREDYIGLVRLVAIAFKSFGDLGTLEYAMKKIKAEYNSDNTSEEKWRDFKRLIDTCLTKRKFRMIRCLREY